MAFTVGCQQGLFIAHLKEVLCKSIATTLGILNEPSNDMLHWYIHASKGHQLLHHSFAPHYLSFHMLCIVERLKRQASDCGTNSNINSSLAVH